MTQQFRTFLASVVGVLAWTLIALCFWAPLFALGVVTGCIAPCATAPYLWLAVYALLMLASVFAVPFYAFRLTRRILRGVKLIAA